MPSQMHESAVALGQLLNSLPLNHTAVLFALLALGTLW